jgi:carboxymethylenebutenolidase
VLLVASACGGGDDRDRRMEREHAGETPTATDATRGLRGTTVGADVVYAAGSGTTATGYLSLPEAGASGIPGVIVIHEWWGLNDNVRRLTDRLAEAGYAVLAVDLYGGVVAEDSELASELSQKVSADMDVARANLVGAYSYLADSLDAPAVGSVGWCFGGFMSLEAAMELPEDLDAAVIYYGRTTDDRERLGPLQVPILGHFGGEDQGIPLDGVRAFEAAMTDLGKEIQVYVYEGAGHAFANPSGQAYQPEAAETAWARTTAFLAQHLGSR